MKRLNIVPALISVMLLYSPAYSDGAGYVRLVLWEQVLPEQDAALDGLIAEFVKANPSVSVKRVDVRADEFARKFLDEASCGAGPDLLLCPAGLIPAFAQDRAIAPVDMVACRGFLDAFEPAALEGARYNGAVYMAPDRRSNGLCLLYNRKMVPSAPESWEALVGTGMKLVKERGMEGAVAMDTGSPLCALAFLNTFGGRVLDRPDFAGAMPALDTPAVREWCVFFDQMRRAKVFSESASSDEARRMFAEGKAPFQIDDIGGFRSSASAARMDAGVSAIPARKGIFPSPFFTVNGYCVSAAAARNAVKKEAAKSFLAFMTGKEAQLRADASYGTTPYLPSARRGNGAFHGTALPSVPQMGAALDAVNAVLRDLLHSRVRPEDAPALMQKKAVEGMKSRGMLVTGSGVRPFGGDD